MDLINGVGAMLVLNSSLSSFETAALNLSYSSHNSLARLRSNEPLIPPTPPDTSKDSNSKKSRTKPVFVHKRVTSNPFDVLYGTTNNSSNRNSNSTQESNSRSPRTPSPKDYYPGGIHPSRLYTPKNIYSPEQVLSPTNGHRRVISDVPPVITLIDQGGLQRSSSVISKDASLKARNSITRRNRMINKKSLDVRSPSADSYSIYETNYNGKSNRFNNDAPSNLKQKIRFLFPVKRKTSLKHRSNYKLLKESRHKRSNFHSKHDLEQFLLSCNAEKIMKELLPKRMAVFDYSYLSLISRKPMMHKSSRYFNINDQNQFHIVSPNAAQKGRFSTAASSYQPGLGTPAKIGIPQDMNPELHREFNVVDAIYSRYRDNVFDNNYDTPPKFTDLFPDEIDNNLVTSKDIDAMNKKVLFEVLLRRTLAAKIEYRLKQTTNLEKSRKHRSKRSRSTKSSRSGSDNTQSSSNSSSGSGNDYNPDEIRHSHVPQLVHTDSETSPDNDSIDTNELMQQNLLLSELLPSPQISYKSNEFELDPNSFFNKSDSDSKNNDKEEVGNDDNDVDSHLKSENKLRRTASTTDLLNLVRQTTTPVPMSIEAKFSTGSPAASTNLNNEPAILNDDWDMGSTSVLQRNNSDNSYYRPNDDVSELHKEFGISQFPYELQPLNRSVDTFSSSENSGMLARTPPIELSRNNSLKSIGTNNTVSRSNSLNNLQSVKRNTKRQSARNNNKRDSNITSTSNSSSNEFDRENKRKSQTTTNTSILQDLDDLSDQLSSYMNDPNAIEEPAHRFVHKNVLSANDPLLTMNQPNPVNLSNQSILETIKLSNPSLEHVKISELPQGNSRGSKQQFVGDGSNIDIKSMQGSLSVVDSDATSFSQAYHYPHTFSNHYKVSSIRQTNPNILRRDNSFSTRTSTTFGKLFEDDRVSPTAQHPNHHYP